MEKWVTGVLNRIEAATGRPMRLCRARTVSGGCINRAVVLEGNGDAYFVKYNAAKRLEMFIAEAEGLRTLATARIVAVPDPVCWGITEDRAFLALEYMQLGEMNRATYVELGRRLAALHRVTQPRYGWHRDNTIGSTPQPNAPADTWTEFFRERRLGYQFGLVRRNAHHRLATKGERLLERLGSFLADHACVPSLCHGDLWAGNVGRTAQGEPVVFDPAIYFGDRETDLAMTELFGGFARSFYAAYREEWPLAPGYETRRTLYNLYHVLNHVNLFGQSYLIQAERMVDQLLSEAG